MKTYAEKLKDPRWQKKRLDIFQRDEFVCQSCNSRHKNLQIHHLYYLPKTNPWDYPSEDLVTLCEDCHEEITFRLPCLLQLLRTPRAVMALTELVKTTGSTDSQNFTLTMETAYGMREIEKAITDDDMTHAANFLQIVRNKLTNIIKTALPV